jgi:site-specific DNA recombinase
MKKALALIRVSGDRQDVARQRGDIEKLKKRHDLAIIRTLELVGVSRTTTLTNEQVTQVLREVEQPGIDGLAASAVDRIFRPKKGSHFGILDGLQEAHRTLWTVRDGVMDLSTDEGWERAMTAGVRAGSELREIRRRCMDGKAEKRAEGRHVNGNQSLPDGLRFDARSGQWSYDEGKADKIRAAYKILFDDHTISLTALAKRVGWRCGFTLRRTLQNPTWRGVRAYPATADQDAFEVDLPLEPLLTPDRWAMAQKLLAKRRTWSKETRDQRFLGAGLLVCECQRRYYTHCDPRRGQHDTYYCASRHPRGKGCGAAHLWRELVDAAIVEIVEERMMDAKFLASVFRRLQETPASDTRAEREKELAKLDARRKRWMDAYDEERIDKREFNERMDKVNAAIRQIEATMPVAPPPVVDDRAVIAGLARTLARFRTWPFLEQRSTLKRVVRGFQVVDGTIPAFTLSGAFLGELSHTNSAQPLRPLCSHRCQPRA